MSFGPEASKFIELDVLRSASGTKGVISQRVSNGVITFSIVREFTRNGIADWTSFFAEGELDDFEDMVQLVKKRIAELRADPKVAPVRSPGRRHEVIVEVDGPARPRKIVGVQR
jgi:hypothetical protein